MTFYVPDDYARDMWQECLDDYLGDEVQAKLVYDRVMQSLARHQDFLARNSRRKARQHVNRARHDSSQSEADTSASADSSESDSIESSSDSESSKSTSDSEESDNEEQKKSKLKWSKPGVLSKRVGVGLSILRNWAKANLVRTIVSSGGHRLFHVQSVLQHIQQAATSSKPKRRRLQASNSAKKKLQLVAYVCMDITNRNETQLQAVGEQIKNQVLQHYKISEDNCSIIVGLRTDAKGAEPLVAGQAIQLTDTSCTRLLLSKISSCSCSKIVLRRTEDISSTPSTYAFFSLLCQTMGISVEIVPELFTHS